ncbi:MAG: hypothetical protein ACRDRO_11820 [Pseudonocardiaceae bacterium]
MQVVRTMAGAAPTSQPIGVFERWRVARHGRRDAQHPPADPGQPHPYLDSLRAHAEVGQRAVSEWLHGKIDPIDREAVQVLILLDQHRRDPMIAPEAAAMKPPADGDPQPLSSIPPRVTKARETAAAQRAYQRWLREQEKAEQRLGELGSTRHHLIEVARAAAHTQIGRYQHLVGLYNTALLRRDPDRYRTGAAAPAISPEPWLYGDLPLVCLEIDGALAEKYRWHLKDFANRTSTVPVGDVGANRN